MKLVDNVIILPVITTIPLEAERVLTQAIAANLTTAIVIGTDAEGALSLSGYYESTWVGDLGDLEKLVQAAIEAIRAELAKPQGEPVGSIMKVHTKQRAGPWCKEILLYSPDNTGDSPENRVMVYTHPAHTEDEVQLILRSNFSDPLFERTVRQTLGVPA